jgi:hypothetical protein
MLELELGPPIGMSPGSAIRKKEATDGNRRQHDMRGAGAARHFGALKAPASGRGRARRH